MAKKKTRSLTVMTLRLNPVHIQKLGYLASEQETTVADILRNLIAVAVRGVTPPKALKAREIVCEEEQWSNWQKVAAKMNTSPDRLITRLMDGLAVRNGFTQTSLAPLAPDLRTEL